MRRCLLILTAMLAGGALAPASAASRDVTAIFQVTADGWRLGELAATYAETGDNYEVTLKGGARGLWGFLLQASYDGRALGTRDATGQPVSKLFEAKSHRIFKSRHQKVDFAAGKPVAVLIDPPKDRTEMSDPTLVGDQRTDPLSYLGVFLQNRLSGCPEPGNLYDGRRVTRVSFNLVTSTSGRIACAGVYEIVKGPDHSIRKGYRSFGVRLEYRPAQEPEQGARLERVDFSSGSSVLVLQRLK